MAEPNRIRELRIKRRLSLDALAKLAGTTNQQVSRLEKGERRLTDHWMRRLAPGLGVKPHELMAPETAAGANQDKGSQEAAALARRMTPDQRAAWFQMGYSVVGTSKKSPPRKARKRAARNL